MRSKFTDMGMCLKYGGIIYDIIMDLFGIIFRNFYNQQNCITIGFNLIYKINSSWFTPNFNRGQKHFLMIFQYGFAPEFCTKVASVRI